MSENPRESVAARTGLLANKTVLVVGASAGIGADAARVFAKEGARLMLIARSAGPLQEIVDELTSAGHEVDAVVGDASVAEDATRFVDATLARFGRLDGALNNAGITSGGRLDDISEREFDELMAINVKGVWLCLREELRAMREVGAGSIVNMSSVSGFRGSTGLGGYQATKHAVIGMTRTAAHDNGPLGIRVNTIAPGPIETPMMATARETIPGGVEGRIAATPLRKIGTGREVGEAAAWLLSDRASHVSGVVLPVDGGYSA
jgi:NAD(P)-dependent dehydrogenase (short-subunit alcohol dehydrogenase family)